MLCLKLFFFLFYIIKWSKMGSYLHNINIWGNFCQTMDILPPGNHILDYGRTHYLFRGGYTIHGRVIGILTIFRSVIEGQVPWHQNVFHYLYLLTLFLIILKKWTLIFLVFVHNCVISHVLVYRPFILIFRLWRHTRNSDTFLYMTIYLKNATCHHYEIFYKKN